MALTFRQAQAALKRYDREAPAAIRRGLDIGSLYALRLAVTKFIVGGGARGRSGVAPPANPPPGPLKARSGDLRRAVKVIPARRVRGEFRSGLRVDLSMAPYGRIHEYGGIINHPGSRPRKGKALRWAASGLSYRSSRRRAGKGDGFIFAKWTRPHKIRIPARPFIAPAQAAAAKYSQAAVETELRALQVRVFGR